MIRFVLGLFGALGVCFVVGCRITDVPFFEVFPTAGDEVRQRPAIAYDDRPDADPIRNVLDVYSPKNRADCPTLVIVHGGAWMHGDNRCCGLYTSIGRHFASRGFVVVMPNYRLSPEVVHPEHVKDFARAVAWTKRNIANHGGDPNRMFLMGHSAGGHLVSLLGTDESYLKAEGLSHADVRGVVSISGVYRTNPGPFLAELGGDGPLAMGVDKMIPLRGDNLPVRPLVKRGPPVRLDIFAMAFTKDPRVREQASPINHVRPDFGRDSEKHEPARRARGSDRRRCWPTRSNQSAAPRSNRCGLFRAFRPRKSADGSLVWSGNVAMARTKDHNSGKQTRPKTTYKGKRYLCARCRKRSPRPVKTPAPWYCDRCLSRDKEETPTAE